MHGCMSSGPPRLSTAACRPSLLPPVCPHVLQVRYGWDGYFSAMIGACVVSLLLLAPLANAKSSAQLQEQQQGDAQLA